MLQCVCEKQKRGTHTMIWELQNNQNQRLGLILVIEVLLLYGQCQEVQNFIMFTAFNTNYTSRIHNTNMYKCILFPGLVLLEGSKG